MGNFLVLISRLLTLIPMGLCSLAVKQGCYWLIGVAVAVMFLLVRLLPYARGRESVVMFIMTAVAFIPLNLWLMESDVVTVVLDSYNRISRRLFWLLIYGFLFSMEELLLGTITRLFWIRQKKTVFHIQWEV